MRLGSWIEGHLCDSHHCEGPKPVRPLSWSLPAATRSCGRSDLAHTLLVYDGSSYPCLENGGDRTRIDRRTEDIRAELCQCCFVVRKGRSRIRCRIRLGFLG